MGGGGGTLVTVITGYNRFGDIGCCQNSVFNRSHAPYILISTYTQRTRYLLTFTDYKLEHIPFRRPPVPTYYFEILINNASRREKINNNTMTRRGKLQPANCVSAHTSRVSSCKLWTLSLIKCNSPDTICYIFSESSRSCF